MSQASGNTPANSAARSASYHRSMNPHAPNVLKHPLARMLPLFQWQTQVYRLAEKFPPGLEDGFTPIWETVTFTLNARQTLQARVNVQREWHLLSLAATSSSNVNGGFRAQLYDMKKQRRLADRGVAFANYFGPANSAAVPASPFFLREPYPLTEKDAQLLVVVQNYETVANTVQLSLYGVARRFNFPA